MLTSHEIASRLKNKMGELKYNDLFKSIETELEQVTLNDENNFSIFNQLYAKHIYPHIRQNGMKIEIKERPIIVDSENNIFKFSSDFGQKLHAEFISNYPEMENKEYEDRYQSFIEYGVLTGNLRKIQHKSLWANNNIYHWGLIKSRMYGPDETDKEIVNDWKLSSKYNKTYFTMYTQDEIKKFCDEWQKKYTIQHDGINCDSFIDEIVNYMSLTEFSN